MSDSTFHLTQDHIDLLEHVSIRWSDVAYGAPGIDEKRPFGNSGSGYIEREICEYLGLEPVATDRHDRPVYDDDAEQDAIQTYNELDTALRIVLSEQTFTPGVFVNEKTYGHDWRRATADELGIDDGSTCPVCDLDTVSGADAACVVTRMDGTVWCRNCRAEFGTKESEME